MACHDNFLTDNRSKINSLIFHINLFYIISISEWIEMGFPHSFKMGYRYNVLYSLIKYFCREIFECTCDTVIEPNHMNLKTERCPKENIFKKTIKNLPRKRKFFRVTCIASKDISDWYSKHNYGFSAPRSDALPVFSNKIRASSSCPQAIRATQRSCKIIISSGARA